MERRRRSRSRVLVVLGLVVLGVALVMLGRFERRHALDHQLAGIDRIRSDIGMSRPDAYRLTPTFACFLYGRGGHSYALELCYDLSGRLVEAIDRRGSTSGFWDVTYDPSEARVRVAPAKLAKVLRSLSAFDLLGTPPGVLPRGLQDNGPRLRGQPYVPPPGTTR